MPLSVEQQQAVSSTSPLTVVVAGAGSGKTRVFVERILNCAYPANTVAISFTNAAADEVRARLEGVGYDWSKLRWLGTLHSWCLREMSLRGRSLKLVGDAEKETAISDTVATLGSIARNMSQAEIWRNALKVPRFGNGRSVGLAVRAWFARKGVSHVDFVLPDFLLLQESVPTPGAILVDEYQDSGDLDEEIYSTFANRGTELFLVGDPRQSIFGFRGARPEIMVEHGASHLDSEYQLVTNYRSRSPIVSYANRLASKMWDGRFKPMAADRSESDPDVTVTRHDSAEEEALWAAWWCDSRCCSLAVLCRYNDQVRSVAGVLRAKGLKVEASTDHELDDNDRGWIQVVIDSCEGELPEEWVSHLTRVGIPFTIQDKLLPLFARCRNPEDLATVASDTAACDSAAIFVGTIHSAKGLEWDAVAVLGCDNATFVPQDEESLRLLYVAATRARDELALSWAASKVQAGSGKRVTVGESPFLNQITP